jgi:hypothetical protein
MRRCRTSIPCTTTNPEVSCQKAALQSSGLTAATLDRIPQVCWYPMCNMLQCEDGPTTSTRHEIVQAQHHYLLALARAYR